MKLFSNLLLIILLVAGVIALIPVISVGFALLCAGAVLILWLLPILIIASSDKTTALEKFCWILAIFCLSWFAWVFYFFLAPLSPKRHYYYY